MNGPTAERKLVAILRGVRPDEVEAICAQIIEAGIAIIEVPLNSPEPLESIKRLSRQFGGDALIGAGTVITAAEVEQVADSGGRLIVSPNCDQDVIRKTLSEKMVSMPGVFTPSECFSAISAGARHLKLFPAILAGPRGLNAIKAVMPPDVSLYAVGGASHENLDEWIAAGATGFGIGSALYKPGMGADEVGQRARQLAAAWDRAKKT